ncbi:MAG: hypothetical protein K1X83_11795 [Oligoflexia bacterium]|nr:hypothetical protein [Oligoflexia bacterium]
MGVAPGPKPATVAPPKPPHVEERSAPADSGVAHATGSTFKLGDRTFTLPPADPAGAHPAAPTPALNGRLPADTSSAASPTVKPEVVGALNELREALSEPAAPFDTNLLSKITPSTREACAGGAYVSDVEAGARTIGLNAPGKDLEHTLTQRFPRHAATISAHFNSARAFERSAKAVHFGEDALEPIHLQVSTEPYSPGQSLEGLSGSVVHATDTDTTAAAGGAPPPGAHPTARPEAKRESGFWRRIRKTQEAAADAVRRPAKPAK